MRSPPEDSGGGELAVARGIVLCYDVCSLGSHGTFVSLFVYVCFGYHLHLNAFTSAPFLPYALYDISFL